MLYVASFLGITYLISRGSFPGSLESAARKKERIMMLLLLFLMGLRHETVFGDAVTYAAVYEYSTIRVGDIGLLLQTEREPLFILLEYFCQRISRNYTFFFFVTSLPIALGYARLLKNYSPDSFMSVLLFFGLGCMYFAMAGLRQAIAMGITMLAFPYAKERKLIPFLMLCLIAYGFHNSSIVFTPIYFVVNWKPNWKMWLAVGVAMMLGLSKNPIVLSLANLFTTKEYEMDIEGLNYTMLFIQLFFLMFCYVFGYLTERHDHEPETKTNHTLLMMGFIGAVFQAFTPIKGEFFRVSLYFSTYLTFAVPRTIQGMDSISNRKLARMGMIAMLMMYVLLISGMRSYNLFFSV